MRIADPVLLLAITFLAAAPALAGPQYTTEFNAAGQITQATPQNRTVSGALPWSWGSGTFVGNAYAGPARVNTSTHTDCNWEGGFSGNFGSWTKAGASTDDFIITGPSGPVHGTIYLRVSAGFDGGGGFPDNNAGYAGAFYFNAGSPYLNAVGQVSWGQFTTSGLWWLGGVTTRSFDVVVPLEANYPVNAPFTFHIDTELSAGCYGNAAYNPGWAQTDGGSGAGVSLGSSGVVMDLPAGYTLNSVAWNIQDNAVVGVDDAPRVTALRLQLAGANPVFGAARLRLSLPQSSRVRATVYDAMGRSVRSLLDGWQEQGTHELHWDGRDEGGATVRAGLYFAMVEAMGEAVTLRVVRVR